ncbi:MAG: ABC transporter [Gammaproteobacteria bacterium]|nr:ABC transporter [Gammaproteobacteria bacterium]
MWNLFSRGWRLARLMAGVRSVSKASDIDQQRRARKALMQQFADARGVMMKVGQLMASAGEVDGELSPLITSIEALSLKQVLPVIERSLGCSWNKVFKSIDESQAAASLGQVHHAVLLNNEWVAIKVQYPDIEKAIAAEMTLLGLMPKAGPVKQWDFDLDGYRLALKQNMELELDYRHEARQQSVFLNNLALKSVVIPKIYDELSSKTLLEQSWEEGAFIDHVASWPETEREKIAKILLGLLLKSVFDLRLLHADPHKGNSYFRYHSTDGIEMVLMDFGCTVELTEQQSMALLKLIISIKEKSSGLPISYFAAMGFDADKLSQIEPYLPKLCLYLFAPFLEDKKFILQQWSLGKKITDLLAEQRWWFRSAGPSSLIFLMRAFQGLAQQLQILKVNINWWQVLNDVLGEELIEKAREYELPVVKTGKASKWQTIETIADVLRVKIMRQGDILVEANLPAEAVLDLKRFIPEEIQLKLEQSSDIDLDEIINRVRQSGIAAQSVFDFDDGEKHYQIWLE